MIHKVEIETDIGSGIKVSHHFEQVVDTAEEAREFGQSASAISYFFNEGYGEGNPAHGNE